MSAPSADDFLRIGPHVRVLPIIHGSGDFAVCVRDELLAHPCDCLAVPLPPSFQTAVEAAIGQLPIVSAVVQRSEAGRLLLRPHRPLSGRHRRPARRPGRNTSRAP